MTPCIDITGQLTTYASTTESTPADRVLLWLTDNPGHDAADVALALGMDLGVAVDAVNELCRMGLLRDGLR